MTRKSVYLQFKDMNNVSEKVFSIGRTYASLVNNSNKIRMKQPVFVEKLFFLFYLTGGHVAPFVKEPFPVLHFFKRNGKTIVGLKHEHVQAIVIDDMYEQAMWSYIVGEELTMHIQAESFDTASFLTKFSSYAHPMESTSRTIQNCFKATLTDGVNIFKDHPISPSHLRQWRAYNLYVNKKYNEAAVTDFFGFTYQSIGRAFPNLKPEIERRSSIETILEEART